MIIDNEIQELVDVVHKLGKQVIRPMAAMTDTKCRWPKKQMQALGKAGLLGLHVPKELGGMGLGLSALIKVSEVIGQYCSSTAMCFVMHSVGTAVITTKATEFHKRKYLIPIAKGKHITTLALSEVGSGSHFYFPETKLKKSKLGFIVNGEKDFITNGSYADSYVISTQSSTKAVGEYNCLIIDNKTKGMMWGKHWSGVGLRGNSSRSLLLKNVKVAKQNLLGEQGDHTYYVFDIVAPYFLAAISGVYLGIAQRALDLTVSHVKARKYSHSGKSVADEPVVQDKLAGMWQKVQRCRALMNYSAYLGDIGSDDASGLIPISRVESADTVISVTNEAMTLTGGMAYADNSELSKLLRDARASKVMAPTPDIIKTWVGRTLVGLPMIGE